MIVDGGGFFGESFDTGERIIAPLMLTRRIKTIDFFVITHPEVDHTGGLQYIIDNFSVGELWITRDALERDQTAPIIDRARRLAIPITVIDAGNATQEICGVYFDFINPPAGYSRISLRKLNDKSLVFRARYGLFSLLMTGDIEGAGMEACLYSGKELSATILKTPHHGGEVARRDYKAFLNAVSPDADIISCGYRNPGGFPKEKTMKLFGELKIKTWRTDLDGAIIIKTNGRRVELETMNGEKKRWALLK